MDDCRALVTLTSEESKRLIAKGIVVLPIVQKAREKGIIGLCICSSARYVAEELLREPLPASAPYICGFVSRQGLYAVPDEKAGKQLVLVDGEAVWLEWPKENITKFIKRMDSHDVIIKSRNILDPSRKAGTLVGLSNGGEYGKYLPYILARGITLIVPMTLNKSVPYHLDEIVLEMGITKISPGRAHGEPCGMIPLQGLVVTECDALETLTGVRVLPVAMGGIGDGQGTVTLLLIGQEQVSLFQFGELFKKHDPMAYRIADMIAWRWGAKSPLSLIAKCKGYVFDPSLITCPTLILIGEGEYQGSKEAQRQQHAGLDAIQNPQKKLVIAPLNEGGGQHVLGENLSLMSQIVFDWLDEVFV